MNLKNLNDDLKGRDKDEARQYLKDFYTLAYQSNFYKPFNAYGVWRRLIKYFREERERFDRLLEVGCGIGLGVSFAREMGLNTWGFDLANVQKYWK